MPTAKNSRSIYIFHPAQPAGSDIAHLNSCITVIDGWLVTSSVVPILILWSPDYYFWFSIPPWNPFFTLRHRMRKVDDSNIGNSDIRLFITFVLRSSARFSTSLH